jgi:hypothetical protein
MRDIPFLAEYYRNPSTDRSFAVALVVNGGTVDSP